MVESLRIALNSLDRDWSIDATMNVFNKAWIHEKNLNHYLHFNLLELLQYHLFQYRLKG